MVLWILFANCSITHWNQCGYAMLELRDLQNLLSLEEHRHFGRAAEAVGLSQPALTKSLQRLERQLGVRLFDRSRARVSPTVVGQEVIQRAKQVSSDVGELERSVDLLCGLQIGTLAVGIGPAMAESYLSEALARIVDEHSRVRISVRVDHWRQLTEWLLSGELDFFVADMADVADDDRLECMALPAEELVWFSRAGHPLAARKNISRGDLFRFPVVTPRLPAWAAEWFAAADYGEDGDDVPSLPTLQCEHYALLKRIVLASDSVSTALEATVRPELKEGRLTSLSVDAPKLKTHAGIVRLRQRSPSPLATQTIDTIISLAKDLQAMGRTPEQR